MNEIRHLCVFCGAKPGTDPKYVTAARAMGRAIAERGWRLVYGGGRVGLMGVLADSALASGGEAIGVIPQALMAREVGHQQLSRLEVVADMAERKRRMVEISDAFVTLPGGLGTLDELFEVLTLRQTRYHGKPVAIFNQDGYFDALLAACRDFVAAGFVTPTDLQFVIDERDAGVLLDRLAAQMAAA